MLLDLSSIGDISLDVHMVRIGGEKLHQQNYQRLPNTAVKNGRVNLQKY